MSDIYHIFADHNANVNAKEFAIKMRKFLDKLVELGRMKSYRLEHERGRHICAS